jgi:hypothetical protein
VGEWLEGLGTGIKRGDLSTLDNKFWPEMYVNGIFERYYFFCPVNYFSLL